MTKHRKAISRLSVLSSPSWPPFSRQAIPILTIIPAQIPGLRPTSLWPTTINKTLSKQRTKVEPEMQLASLGLSFIALFLCDERASIRKLKMYFAFRSPLLLLLPSGEKGMKCNKNENEKKSSSRSVGNWGKITGKKGKIRKRSGAAEQMAIAFGALHFAWQQQHWQQRQLSAVYNNIGTSTWLTWLTVKLWPIKREHCHGKNGVCFRP